MPVGLVILLAVATGTTVLLMVRRAARGRRRVRCGARAGRQWPWPARLRRAAARTDTWLLIATLVLVVLTFLTLLAAGRPADDAGRAPTARWPVPGGSSSPPHLDHRWRPL